MTLETPVEQIPRIGPVFLKKLKKMGIETILDLIFHFPHRYEDFSNIIPIAKIKTNEPCCIAGKILEIKTTRTWKRKMFLTSAILEDKTGAIKIVWFNQPYITKTLKKGDTICLSGKAIFGKNGLSITSPVFEKIPNTKYSIQNTDFTHTGRIVPVYPETAGLSSRWLRYILKPLLAEFKNKIPEILPAEIMKKQKLMPVEQAIWQIHFPDSLAKAEKSNKRFSFEELFLIELAVLKKKFKLNEKKAPSIPLDIKSIQKFVSRLPFKLTDAQKKCAWRILKDMEKHSPMSRLLEGDVGSGKTVVAVIAALNSAKAGYQTAFMAPTEILAKQHFAEVSKLTAGLKTRVALLTGKEDKIICQKLKNEILEISRTKLLEKAKQGEIDILIGTHSLIQDTVRFGNLAFCIIDEQHRFGVKQRAKLVSRQTTRNNTPNYAKENIPHLLSMTATPIPRSLALTIYGDLDLSVLDEQPKGRKKVITEVVPPAHRKKTYDFIRKQIKKGEQVFVICPRIEPNKSKCQNPNVQSNPNVKCQKESLNSWTDVKAVKEEYEKLSTKIFPDLRIEMLHGKMKTKEKEKIMQRFRNKKNDILVSTSVIEVGIDIPQATIMLIEGAERFGLSQLHQFRGRVGRSDLQSYCFLFTDSPAKKTQQRLRAIITAKNGFELAEKDLKIRGPGSLYGVKQWGIPDLAMQNLSNVSLVETTRETAKELLISDPELKKHPALKARMKILKTKIHLE